MWTIWPGNRRRVRVPALVIRYAVAVVITTLVFAGRCLLDPVLGGHYAITPFIFATAFAAWYGGWKPGVLSLGLGLALGDYFFMHPRGSFIIEGVEHRAETIIYLLASGGSILLVESLRAAKSRVETVNVELLHAQNRFRRLLDSSAGGIYGIDMRGRCTFINKAGAKMIGTD